MSQETVRELLRRLRDAINAFMRDEMSSEALAELLDPQVEYRWHDQRTYPDVPQHLRGAAAVIRFMEQYRGTRDELVQEPLEFIEAPDGRIVVSIRQTGRGRESGVPIVIHFFEVCTIRDGKVRTVEYFRHRTDALQAAGVRE